MFFTSNIESNDPNELIRTMFGSDYDEDTPLPSFYRLNTPIRLQLSTIHLESEDSQYALTSCSPQGTVHSQSSLNEFISTGKVHMHQHDYYEIVFVIRGELHQLIENVQHIYTAGSCCILNKNVRHTEVFDSDCQVAFLAISDEFLSDVISELSSNYFDVERNHTPSTLQEFFVNNSDASGSTQKNYVDLIPLKDEAWVERNIHHIFDLITNEMIAPKLGSSHFIRECFWKLMAMLSNEENFTTTPIQIGTDAENELFNAISKKMEDSNGRITRSELVEELHYSGTYLNDITKKYTGLSIFDYGMYFCMTRASELLLNTDMNIQDISLALGFSNRSHFYKIFQKKYHLTPAQYRKQFR